MNVLTLNSGSNSLKFEIFAVQEMLNGSPANFGTPLVSGAYDNIGKEHPTFSLLDSKKTIRADEVEIKDHGHATQLLFDWLESGGARQQGIDGLDAIHRIGHRVVHGADRFFGPARIDGDVIRKIQELEDLAPLHNVSALKVIHAAQKRITSRVPMIAVFDTVFHQTIPESAALYPLPIEFAKRHGIRRYGFHGISHRYMMTRFAQLTNRPAEQLKLITLHLEGGSSLAAIRNGESIDTSMGFTPLEGLMMGTRTGDIDPAIVTYLMRKEGMDSEQVEKFLNKECGLLGVSGLSADTRVLQKHLSEKLVDLAISMFCYRVRKYVGAYLAVLEGADAIVVGGGIGENTPFVRERIFNGFDWLGAALDRKRNEETIDREGPITTDNSKIPIWIVPTQEGMMLAKDVAEYRD